MNFVVGNKIKVSDYDVGFLKWCKKWLTIPNPEYHKKERMGLWCGNIPKEIVLYEQDGKDLYLPFGLFSFLQKKGYINVEHETAFDFGSFRQVNYQSNIKLYPYQETAVQRATDTKNGIIVMPCGAGKTQTALELIARIGSKALWLTHTQDLLNQSMNRAKANFGIDNSTYGTITGGKVNIGFGITFATVQTMSKLDLSQYKYTWDIVIVDECHRAIGSPTKVMQFYKVISNLSCRYKFGITATPKRADGLSNSMFALLGNIIHEVTKQEVADTTCEIKVKRIETGYTPNYDVVLSGDGTINYASLVEDLTQNFDRFTFVLQYIEALSLNGSVLVLANRVSYLDRLNKSFSGIGVCLSTLGTSKSAKETRKRILKELNDGKIDCVFATYQLAKEGLDIPNLRYVIFATPEKDETTIIQSVGRVGRKYKDKPFGTVIDFVDNFGMLKGWAKKRAKYYEKLDCNIQDVVLEETLSML